MGKTVLAAVKAEMAQDETTPIKLFEIALDGTTLRFCDQETDVVFPTGGNTYSGWEAKYGGAKTSLKGAVVDRVQVTFDNTDLTFGGYIESYTFQGRKLTIKRVMAGLLDAADKAVTIFSGKITEIHIDQEKVSLLVVSPLLSLERTIPKRRYGPGCPWVFGGSECGASTGELTSQTADSGCSVSAVVDAARTEADDYWRHGVLTCTSGANNGLSRTIASSVNATGTINLITSLPSAPAAGDTYTIRRGCRKSASDCDNIFSNFNNFGGFTTLPARKK